MIYSVSRVFNTISPLKRPRTYENKRLKAKHVRYKILLHTDYLTLKTILAKFPMSNIVSKMNVIIRTSIAMLPMSAA